MFYKSEFRDFFSYAATTVSSKAYMKTVLQEFLGMGVDFDFQSVKLQDMVLLLVYRSTVTSNTLCSTLLSWRSDDMVKTIASVFPRLVKLGLVVRYPLTLYTSQSRSICDTRYVYTLSSKGERYVCARFDLPELQPWEKTSVSVCLHTYQNTLTILQLILQRVIDADRHRGKAYVPLWKLGTDQFAREYMLDKQSYKTVRQTVGKTQRNLIADAIYTISDPMYSNKDYYDDNYSRSYYLAPFNPIVLDDSRDIQLPLHIFIEADMRTERNPVIIEKLARYTDVQTISRTGSYSYRDSCILFSCYDTPAVPSEPWLFSKPSLANLVQRAQDASEDNRPVLRDDFLERISDLPEAIQKGYREVDEFYRRKDCKTALQLLQQYSADRTNMRLPLLSQYKSEFLAKRCRARIAQVYKSLYADLYNLQANGNISYVSNQSNCCKVIRECLEGLRCYFFSASTIWQSSSRIYHNPDFLSWIVSTYYAGEYALLADIKPRLNASENGVRVILSTYEQTPPDKVPAFDNDLGIHFSQCLTLRRDDTDTDQYTFVFEDLSDLGSWVRITEYFRRYPNGTDTLRIICLYESEEDVKSFAKTTGIYGIIEDDKTLFQSPTGISYISTKGYFSNKMSLDKWNEMSDKDKIAWSQRARSYQLRAVAEGDVIVFRDGNY